MYKQYIDEAWSNKVEERHENFRVKVNKNADDDDGGDNGEI